MLLTLVLRRHPLARDQCERMALLFQWVAGQYRF
jgi:hypothetical protein